MIKTVRCRLNVTPDDRAALRQTLNKFADACNDALTYSRETGKTHRYAIQSGIYKKLKVKHGLTAMYAVRACDRVAASLTAKHKVRKYKPTSATIDRDLVRYIPKSETVSISTVNGRKKIPLALGDYQRGLLAQWTPGIGQLSVTRAGDFYICLRVNIATPTPGGVEALGVDLGIKRIATTSEGLMFSGRKLNRLRQRYAATRASLQAKGTKGAKRTLKRLSGRSARFQKDVNHCISKQIVASAKELDAFIALENLKGIRGRVQNRNKGFRCSLGAWAFYQLREFIAYKSEEAGVKVVFINPAYTSKTCPHCRHIGDRHKHQFSCFTCGFVGDADKVGAFNIAALGAKSNALKSPAPLSDKALAN